LERAIQHNDSWATNSFAELYLKGKGIEKNISEAIRLFKNAISLNDSYGMVQFRRIYQRGEEVEKNTSEAIVLSKGN
jgi:TPR repeat protein